MSKGLPFISHNDSVVVDVILENCGHRHCIKLKTSGNAHLETGGSVWYAGIALSRHLVANPDIVRGKSVLELGSGCGLVGLTAAILGAREVLFSDIDHQEEILVENINMNRHLWQEFTSCSFRPLNFGDSVPTMCSDGSGEYDVLLGSDIGYDSTLHEPLYSTILSFFGPHSMRTNSRPKEVFLAEEIRWKDVFSWYKEGLVDVASCLPSSPEMGCDYNGYGNENGDVDDNNADDTVEVIDDRIEYCKFGSGGDDYIGDVGGSSSGLGDGGSEGGVGRRLFELTDVEWASADNPVIVTLSKQHQPPTTTQEQHNDGLAVPNGASNTSAAVPTPLAIPLSVPTPLAIPLPVPQSRSPVHFLILRSM